jgi:predicted RNA-binding Zn-ribbon protein involved in translation (DUF1610 family)
MLNRERTKEVFGYDIDPSVRRRTNAEFASTNKISKKNLKVIDNCPSCGVERTITLRASRKNALCYKCHHNRPEMIEVKRNQSKFVSEESKRKMSESHWSKQGMESPFKGRKHTKSAKRKLSQATKVWYQNAPKEEVLRRAIKASCTVRGIEVENFDGWAVEGQRKERSSPEYKAFEIAVLQRDKNRCTAPACIVKRKSNLTVHHKDGFYWCVERRFDVDNGVTLCHAHRKEFHDEYGRRENTEAQFNEWMSRMHANYSAPVKLIIVCGPSGSGKSWVCNQLSDEYSYVSFDKVPKEQHLLKIMQLASQCPNKPVLYDPFRKASTIFSRYSQVWPCELIAIDESLDTICERIASRGGVPDRDEIAKAVKRHQSTVAKSHFSGTSTEVLNYLRSIFPKV